MRLPSEPRYRLVAVGASRGGVAALTTLVQALPAGMPMPVVIVQHLGAGVKSHLADLLQARTALRVKEADDLEPLEAGVIYVSPPDYHLQVEPQGTLSLSTEAPVHGSRPSVDVLFETASLAFGPALIGVLLTGLGWDGSQGLKAIHDRGGLTIVQDPEEALADAMPRNAIRLQAPDHVAPILAISELLIKLGAVTHLP